MLSLHSAIFFVLCLTFVSSGPSVIVIGAGASGIAAATRLLKNGITNITVLEAEDRIGGRIHSVKLGDGYLDLGGEWCHGDKGNIVYEIVKDLNVLRHTKAYFPDFHHFNKGKLDQSFSKSLMDIIYELRYDVNRTGANLGEYMVKRYYEKIAPWKDDNEKYVVAQRTVNAVEGFQVSLDGSFSWYDVAASTNFEDSNDDLSWNGLGYKTILEVLMQKYPDSTNALPIDDRILLKKEVQQINWGSTPIAVKCTDGTTYSADHVIVTVSLGVLKHQHNDFFKPPLPVDKVQAIEQLGIAGVHKIFFHYPRRFWNDTYPGSVFIWNRPIQTRNQWITALVYVMKLDHSPNVLEAWFYGPNVPYIEQLSDEEIINGFQYALEYFDVDDFRRRDAGPDRLVRNKWYSNRHFRGTYSFDTPSTRQGDRTILAEPVYKVSFAGEASNPTHYGTVHGAIETGFREANRLIQMYR